MRALSLLGACALTTACSMTPPLPVPRVETPAQWAIALQEGCDEVQGFLYSRPRPADEIGGVIAAIEARPRPLPQDNGGHV